MAARGHMLEFEGHAKQPSALMHDVSYPPLGRFASHHILDSHSSPDHLERKLLLQGAEMEKLAMENQRLAATHVSLRRELAGTQLDLEKVRSYMRTMQAECDIESRGLLEEIAKMEADLHTSESLHQNLQEAHMERKQIDASRQELSSEIQKYNEELLAARADLKSLQEMHAEIEGLKQEHQRLRYAPFSFDLSILVKQIY